MTYLILSVDPTGLISKWDTLNARDQGAPMEYHVNLHLTPEQLEQLNLASKWRLR